jgi:hypothetical protein
MLGVHFAITPDYERALLAAAESDDCETVAEMVEEIEESGQDQLKVDTYKAWDAIHRCLAGGTLDPQDGNYPLSHAVLGGRHLHDEYYAVYVKAGEVRDVAVALQDIDREWFRHRFESIDDPDYPGARDAADFDYTWTNFVDLQAFYQQAADRGSAVLFTAT